MSRFFALLLFLLCVIILLLAAWSDQKQDCWQHGLNVKWRLLMRSKLFLVSVICVFYLFYHCYKVYKFLKWHENHIEEVIKRAKMKEKNGIKSSIKYSYNEIVSDEQFNSNMEYFKNNRDTRGGFYFIDGPIMAAFSESASFLGGGRAALLQVAHPMVATAVKAHSYVIKRAQKKASCPMNNKSMKSMKSMKSFGVGCPVINMNELDPKLMSQALKKRFNRTLAIMFPIVYGPLDLSLISSKKAWSAHKTVNGYIQNEHDTEIIGDGKIFNKNTYYSACMVMTLRWVFATLHEGTIFMQQMMGKLPYKNLSEKQMAFFSEYHQASAFLAMAFGLSKEQIPKTMEEFEEYYFYHMMESGHIVISKDSANWCKIFFISNHWYLAPVVYAIKCYTALIFPKSVRDKFNEFDPIANLLPYTYFNYFYGLFWLGLFRGVYTLLPESVRYFNDYIALNERVKGENYYNWFQRLMKRLSGKCGTYFVDTLIDA